MAYDRNSPEAKVGWRIERKVIELLRARGRAILHAANMGIGAAMVEMPDGSKCRAMDVMSAHDQRLGDGGHPPAWDEVKYKTAPDLFQILRTNRHGVDRPNWNDYLELEQRMGIPGFLNIIQLKESRDAKSIEPRWLRAALSHLRDELGRGSHHYGPACRDFPRGGVFWDVASFTDMGEVGLGEEPLPQTRLNLHPWERRGRDGGLPKFGTREGWAENQTTFDFTKGGMSDG